MKKHIPNIITLGNVLCGSFATVLVLNSDRYLHVAILLILAGAILDFLDGFVARLLKAYSAVGKELDSLADMVSFGLAPAAFLSMLVRQQLGYTGILDFEQMQTMEIVQIFFPFIVTAFSALRLARFNVDTRQTSSFIGMPTPASTLFVVSLVIIALYGSFETINNVVLSIRSLLIISGVLSYLLISPIPMFSLKFKTYGVKGNMIRYSFLLLSIIVIATLKVYALSAIMVLYILFSLLENVIKHLNKKEDI